MKQGRLARYSSKAERDKFLKKEISSIETYQETQQRNLEETEAELNSAQEQLAKAETRAEEVEKNIEDRRERMRSMGDEITALKNEQAKLQDQRRYFRLTRQFTL